MPEPATPSNSNDSPPAPNAFGPLPGIECSLSGAEILARLDAAARRGKLPGFERGDSPTNFHLADFGTPFESVLDAHATPSGSGTALAFSLRLKPLMPRIFIAIMVLSVWPGVWLTDSMIRTYFSSYPAPWVTYAWYLPLTILPAPFAISQALKRSRASARAEALLLIEKVRTIVNAAPRADAPTSTQVPEAA